MSRREVRLRCCVLSVNEILGCYIRETSALPQPVNGRQRH
jgi:hypothetical protein